MCRMWLYRKCGFSWCAKHFGAWASYCSGIKNIRAGLARRACEVNRISGQQQEPTESSPRKAWELVGIPVLWGEGDVN